MGAHNFTVTYDGEFSDISMPFNDIALTIKSSIPSTTIKFGVKTEYIFDEKGMIAGVIPKAYKMNLKLSDKKIDSHSKYEQSMESQLYG